MDLGSRPVLAFLSLSLCLPALGAEASSPSVGAPGGLCVQLGGGDLEGAVEFARTGRFLVHVLIADPEAVAVARGEIRARGLYGLVSVERWAERGRLPYTERLVNLILVGERPGGGVPLEECARVLCPLGVLIAPAGVLSPAGARTAGLEPARGIDPPRGYLAARKPWPPEMDEWSHPRHGADGNAVSRDTLVGPPRRVRWLAGPWREVANLVTSGGRNYYGGLIARDGFNGLRLWKRSLSPSPTKGGFSFRPAANAPDPVAGAGRVFVFTEGELVALDGATGRKVRAYREAGKPREVLHDAGRLFAIGASGLRAIDVESGRVLWSREAARLRCVVAGGDTVGLVEGDPRLGEKSAVLALEATRGAVRWRREDLPWAASAYRGVLHRGMLTLEVSTLSNDGPGNAIHILDASDGRVLLEREFLPGMSHMRQARASFVGDTLWLLHGGKGAGKERYPTKISAIDVLTGKVRATHSAGLVHCFPPVATSRFFFSGEMDLTDLGTGRRDANQITKAACGRDSGWVPAHGLIYVTPKHCVCWPMLRGYAALAPARPGGNPARANLSEIAFPLEVGPAFSAASGRPEEARGGGDWPMYRHDAWRSGSTPAAGPARLDTLWAADLGGDLPAMGPITEDWAEDPFVKGPVTPPVIAEGIVVVARPHAHEVVALDAKSGAPRWRFTASGRVDTPPTIYRGLCLFGSASGHVYCLRAADGELAWRLRAAPLEERIVAYGGLESPWPVPGSVLVVDGVAYFAAGRQSLADGGILVFAVDPASGERRWVRRLDTIPQQGFYESSALEFDNFDILFRQGRSVAMSRWLFDRRTGEMSVRRWDAFARLDTGGGSVMAPQGSWSYAPRNQSRTKTFSPLRPLVAFRGRTLFGSREEKRSLYRRDFDLEGGEKFETHWITGWAGSDGSRKPGGLAWRSQRLSEKASWSREVLGRQEKGQRIAALLLASDRLYLVGSAGALRVLSAADGHALAKRDVLEPVWDGLAAAGGRLYLSTKGGRLLCLGEARSARESSPAPQGVRSRSRETLAGAP